VIRRVSGVVSLVVACGLAAAPAAAQHVTLRIAPPEGDTLRMQLEQRFEMQSGNQATVLSGAMRIWTHAVVLRRARGFTELLSVTDSVRVYPAATALPPLRDAQRALQGRVVRLRVDDGGGMSLSNGPNVAFGTGTEMPPMLPSHPVSVGESWKRDMRVPLSATRSSTAEVQTTFRLDSLTNHGSMAYVSFQGAVSHDHSQDAPGTVGRTVGTLEGSMQVDRRLAWVTDSRMVVSVVSDVRLPGKPATHARMRITQSLRALAGN
jgi:hypothetical protein